MPYFIASHPGSDLDAMIDLALFLKRNDYRPDQVQDFIPSPFDIATCMYYTGLDPFTKKPVYVAKHLRDRKLQRALMQFFKPENYFEVREALEQGGPAGPDRQRLRLPDSRPARPKRRSIAAASKRPNKCASKRPATTFAASRPAAIAPSARRPRSEIVGVASDDVRIRRV